MPTADRSPSRREALRARDVAVVIDPGGLTGAPDRHGQPGRRIALEGLPDPLSGRSCPPWRSASPSHPARTGSSWRSRRRNAAALRWSPPRTPPPGGSPRATSVASRRSAAWVPASSRSSSSAWALAIAVAASSMKSAIRDSVPGGKSGCEVAATADAPVAAADHDGRGDPGPHAQPADHSRRTGRRQPFAVDPRRAPGAERVGLDRPGQQPEPEADRYLVTDPAVGPDDGDISRRLPALRGRLVNAGDERGIGADQAAELIGDRAEHLGPAAPRWPPAWPPAAARPAPRQAPQPRLAGRITACPRVGGMAPVGAGIWRVHTADGSPMSGRPTTLGPRRAASRLTVIAGLRPVSPDNSS